MAQAEQLAYSQPTYSSGFWRLGSATSRGWQCLVRASLQASALPSFIHILSLSPHPLIPGWLLTYYVAQTVVEVVAILLLQFLRLQEWITMSGFGINKK